jgi:hypothetical protein
MPVAEVKKWYHSNQYSADSKCEHCGGVVRHEDWCATQNPLVAYAYMTAADAAPISEQDGLILHALGVTWTDPNGCRCQSEPQMEAAGRLGISFAHTRSR